MLLPAAVLPRKSGRDLPDHQLACADPAFMDLRAIIFLCSLVLDCSWVWGVSAADEKIILQSILFGGTIVITMC